jgi:hypothetical protein
LPVSGNTCIKPRALVRDGARIETRFDGNQRLDECRVQSRDAGIARDQRFEALRARGIRRAPIKRRSRERIDRARPRRNRRARCIERRPALVEKPVARIHAVIGDVRMPLRVDVRPQVGGRRRRMQQR